MKKYLFSVVLFIAISFVAVSQPCTPDPALTVPGFSPDSVTNLPPGTAGQYYQAVISAKIPTDTVFLGMTVQIDSIGVTNVIGLPAGLTWVTDSPNNYWGGGQKGCLLIEGTTTVEGVHNLKIALMAHGGLPGLPLTVPDTVKFYKIDMQPSGVVSLSRESFSVGKAFPNPANDFTTIEVISSGNEQVSFTLFNLVGTVISESKHQLSPGLNNLTVSLKQFPAGMYFYKISNGENVITRKLNISR